MKKNQLIKFLKKNRNYFRASSSILEFLWHAREGGNVSKVLAGVSTAGQIIDLIYPDPDPYTAMANEGLVCLSVSIGHFLYEILLNDQAPELLASSPYERAYVWREDGQVKFGVAVSNYDNIRFFILPGEEEYFYNYVRQAVWKTSKELEVSKSESKYNKGGLYLTPLSQLGPYLGKKDVDWYVNRIKKYAPGPRTILFRGPTGIGKGVLARHIGRNLKGNSNLTLKISSQSLKNCEQKEILDLVEILQPNILLLDDLKLNDPEMTASFLALFEILRDPECLVIATMMIKNPNEKPKIGLWHCDGMRPGRIDETFVLSLPDYQERLQILSYYSIQNGYMPLLSNTEILKQLAERSDGLSGAYLASLAERIKTHGLENWEYELEQVLCSAPDQSTKPKEESKKENSPSKIEESDEED